MYPLHDEKECKGCNCPEHGKSDDWSGLIFSVLVTIVATLIVYWLD